ncbi:MAG: sodium:calcium antiporter [Thermoleophilia bacterium]
MLLNFFYILGGLVLLAIGAEGLVRGSTGLALRLGITSLAVGLTVVAFGTGSPELVLGIEAAHAGNSGIALGNVVGSNISNVALVLGIAALVKPMRVRSELIRREMPLMIAVMLLLWVMLLDDGLSRVEGLVLVVGAVAYTVFSYMVARHGESVMVDVEFDEALAGRKQPVWLDTLLFSAGLVSLLVGGEPAAQGRHVRGG